MKALVTGAGGFLGKRLLSKLAEVGCESVTLGRTSVLGVRHFQLDSIDAVETIQDCVTEVAPDYLFHLAGHVVGGSAFDAYKVNVGYAISLLGALDSAGLDKTRVMIVGSAAEYGLVKEDDLPLSEAYCPRPYSDYGISKLAQTHYALSQARAGRPLVVVRPFTLIGAGMPTYLAIGSFVRQLLDIRAKGSSGVLHTGNIETSRDFLDVEDAAELMWRLVNSPDAYGSVVNLCSQQPVKIREILEQAIAFSGADIRIEQKTERIKASDMSVHYGDNSRLMGLVGAFQFRPWNESIADMMQFDE